MGKQENAITLSQYQEIKNKTFTIFKFNSVTGKYAGSHNNMSMKQVVEFQLEGLKRGEVTVVYPDHTWLNNRATVPSHVKYDHSSLKFHLASYNLIVGWNSREQGPLEWQDLEDHLKEAGFEFVDHQGNAVDVNACRCYPDAIMLSCPVHGEAAKKLIGG